MLSAMSPYGGVPVKSSMTVQPSDQMSDCVDAGLSSMTSGAVQFGMPTTSFMYPMARKLSETPKSESLTFPFRVVRIFAALRLRCKTSLWCR